MVLNINRSLYLIKIGAILALTKLIMLFQTHLIGYLVSFLVHEPATIYLKPISYPFVFALMFLVLEAFKKVCVNSCLSVN